jgi:hypothetical protein
MCHVPHSLRSYVEVQNIQTYIEPAKSSVEHSPPTAGGQVGSPAGICLSLALLEDGENFAHNALRNTFIKIIT